MTIISGSK